MTAQNSDLRRPPDSAITPTPVGVLGLTRILLRWTPFVLPLAALSLYFAVNQTSEIDPEFTAEASVLLIGPNEERTRDFDTGRIFVEDVNPLNSLGGSLNTVATVTAIAMTSGPVIDQLESEALSTNVVVWVESRSPIVRIEAVDSDRDKAAATSDRLVELITEDLQERQDALDAPSTDRISTQRISASTVGGADYGGRNRVIIIIAVLGIGFSVAAAFLFEGLYQLYRRYRIRKREAGNVTPEQLPPADGAENTPATVGISEEMLTSLDPVDEEQELKT